MALDTRSIDAVTRACYARGVSAANWANLVRQAAQAAGTSAEGVEKESTTVLLALLKSSASPPPLVLQYLKQFLQRSGTSPNLARPGNLAREAVTASLALPSLEAVSAAINSALSASPKEPVYLSSSSDDTARGLLSILDHLIPSVSPSSAPETAAWISRFLSKPPHRISKKTVSSELLEQCTAALRQAVEVQQDRRLKGELGMVLSRLSVGGRRRAQAPMPLDEVTRPLSLEPDAVLLVSDLLAHPHRPAAQIVFTLSSFLSYGTSQAAFRQSTPLEALSRALAELLYPVLTAVSSSRREDKAVEGLVFAKLPYVLKSLESRVDNGVSFHDALVASLRLVQSSTVAVPASNAMDVDCASSSSSFATFEKLVIAFCRQELLSLDEGASLAVNVERGELEPVELSDYTSRLASGDPDELKQALDELVSSFPAQRAISSAIRDTVTSLASSTPPDLHNLATTCETLFSTPDALSVILLHIEPKDLLAPVRKVLDELDMQQNDFGEENSSERYGVLVLFVEIVVARFNLSSNLAYHLGSSSSFFAAWFPSSSATYPLSIMTDEERAAVSGWIAALFGEGISDDLMHATNPRTLLRVAPTILKQSLMACQAGVVDLDNLRDALSYFLQELLRFTLPGVLRWLIEEIARAPPSVHQSNMLDILQVFVFSDQLPPPVLELIAPDLASLLTTLPPKGEGEKQPEKQLDRGKLRKLIAPYRPKDPAVEWASTEGAIGLRSSPYPAVALMIATSTAAETWQQELFASLSSLIDPTSPPTSPLPNLAHSLTSALSTSPSPLVFLRDNLLSHLLTLASTPPPPANSSSPLEQHLRRFRIERAGSSIIVFSPSSAGHTTSPPLPPLFTALTSHLLPSLFPSWAGRRLPPAGASTTAAEQPKLELLADMLGGAVVLLFDREERAGEVQSAARRALEQLEKTAVGAVREVQRGKKKAGAGEGGEEEEEDEDDSPSALSVFLERLLSWSTVAERCAGLIELVDAA
ncbi:hypothetical protein JCM10213_008549 [Rhodosporidiobolus nylandii]